MLTHRRLYMRSLTWAYLVSPCSSMDRVAYLLWASCRFESDQGDTFVGRSANGKLADSKFAECRFNPGPLHRQHLKGAFNLTVKG